MSSFLFERLFSKIITVGWFFFEYLDDAQFVSVAVSKLRNVRGGIYTVLSYVIDNNAGTKMPLQRCRLFILAMHTEKLTILKNTNEWAEDLIMLLRPLPEMSLNGIALSNDHEIVTKALQEYKECKKVNDWRKRTTSKQKRLAWSKNFEDHIIFRIFFVVTLPPPHEWASHATGALNL